MFLLPLFVAAAAANDVIFVSVLLVPVTLPATAAAAAGAEGPTARFVLSTSSIY
jgi:hypothetical protein